MQGAKPPFSASAEGASREGIQRPSSFSLPLYGVALLPRRSNRVVRRSPRVRRCSNATRSVQRRLCPSVEPVGVGHSEPPSEGQRPWSLEPLWGRSLHVPTPKQETPTSRTEARSADGVDRGSSPTAVSGGCRIFCGQKLVFTSRERGKPGRCIAPFDRALVLAPGPRPNSGSRTSRNAGGNRLFRRRFTTLYR